MSHAMVLTGVNLYDGKPNRWKIENSWGDERGDKGYYVCSDTWFDAYVFQAVVHRKYLAQYAEQLAETPVLLKPWDPMGLWRTELDKPKKTCYNICSICRNAVNKRSTRTFSTEKAAGRNAVV